MTDKQAALQVGKRIAGGQGLSSVLLRRASEVALDQDDLPPEEPHRGDRFAGLRGLLHRGAAATARTLRGRRRARGRRRLAGAREGGAAAGAGGARAAPTTAAPFDLLRAAYHLGSRHVPLELQPDRLLLEPDHALADLLRDQHLIVTEATSAFEPEDRVRTERARAGRRVTHMR